MSEWLISSGSFPHRTACWQDQKHQLNTSREEAQEPGELSFASSLQCRRSFFSGQHVLFFAKVDTSHLRKAYPVYLHDTSLGLKKTPFFSLLLLLLMFGKGMSFHIQIGNKSRDKSLRYKPLFSQLLPPRPSGGGMPTRPASCCCACLAKVQLKMERKWNE